MLGIVALVAAAGAFGGFATGLIAGEFKLPKWDKAEGAFRPGFVGDVLLGVVAALVVWGVYGPAASATVIGERAGAPTTALSWAELFSALLTGIGGRAILGAQIKKKVLETEKATLVEEKKDLDEAKKNLADAVDKLKGGTP